MPVMRIQNAVLLTMQPGSEPVRAGVIEWEGASITYAGDAAGAPTRPADEVIDGAGCVVIPGLVNAHTHLAMVLFRGFADDMPLKPWLEERIWPTEMKLTPEDVYWGTRLGVLESLRGGVTCFNDMYHYYEAATQAAVDGGIRACPSGVLLGFLSNAEEMLQAALEFTDRMRATHGDRIHPMIGPHAPYTCPPDLLREVVAGAQSRGVPVHIHVSETEQEFRDSLQEHDLTPVQHLEALGLLDCKVSAAHCVWLDDRDLEILAQRQVGVVHCPGSNMKLASGFARVPDLLERGAVVALGTDGAASNNNLDMFEEMLLAALIHKGRSGDPTVVQAEQALAMATRDAARACGIGDLVGTLEPGKRADLAVVDLDRPHLQPVHHEVSHLVYAAGAPDVRMTVVNGEVVMRDGEFPGQDAEEALRECAARAQRLCGE
jgi:5-methylthioadenosine/S-adenosylhomocysteine deaminase